MAYKKNSFFCIAFTAIFTEFNSNLFSASAVVVLSFTAGYSLFVTLREIWNPIKLLYVLVLLFLSMILLFLKENVTQWLKNSMAYRFYKYIWE